MKTIWIVGKNELYRYFASPLAYVYLIAFLLLNGSFAIYFGHFFDRGIADLRPMFVFQPWLYLLFIPGISMRLWAEEFRSKTIVQIMTMPVSAAALVWGKFAASWVFCALALILTFPFWITVNILGTPDNGVIALGYLGSFILAGCMLAVSQTMSALTKNQVIALVLAVIANLVFFLSGLEYILSFFRLFAPLSIIDMIASFSFLTHFDTISQGLLELRDLIFFASLIILFNLTTVLIVSFRTSGTSRWLKSGSRNYYILTFATLLCGFVGLNLLANNLARRFQLDVTEEKIFTLTDTTRRLLKNLPEPVLAKLYYSPVLGERDPEIRLMFDKVRLLLRQYEKLSGGRFSYRIYNPEPLSAKEDQAIAAGIQPLPVIDMNVNAFFGLSLSDAIDDKRVIPFFPLERQEFLEQDITQKIYELGHRKKTLGLISSLPVFDTILNDNVVTQKWEIISQIQQLYNVRSIAGADDLTDDIDVLMLVNPQITDEKLAEKIRQYSLKGGNALVFLDNAAEAPRIFSPINHEYVPSYLGKLEEFWGFRFDHGLLAADLDNSLTVDATSNYKSNPTYTQDVIQYILKPGNLNPEQPETAKLKGVSFSSASGIEPAAADTVFVPLFKTSRNAAYISADAVYDNINPGIILSSFQSDNAEKIIGAAISSTRPDKPFRLIVVGDTDLLYDTFWTKTENILDNQYSIPVLDNGNFVLNALESLTGGENLIELRGKSAQTRRFENIEKLRRQNQLEFKIKEQEIFDKIERTKKELQEIWSKKDFEGRSNFTADELAVIAGIRTRLEALRADLGKIRGDMNRKINRIDTTIKFLNIYAIPLLLILILATNILWRRRNSPQTTQPLALNRRFWILAASCLAILAAGLVAAVLSDRSSIAEYENKPAFPSLRNHINDVEEITLRSHDASLTFYKSDELWKLKRYEDFPVYQERIRSFLSALLEAVYYEKKSARAEHLGRFGLDPIEVPGSPNIRIELKDQNRRSLTSFEVGKFNVDIGRGAQAAYIKFDNQFQVWLVAAEFIDLSTDWRDWTYSTLWNLRFGRLAAANGITDADRLAELAKTLLNTSLSAPVSAPQSAKRLFALDLEIEGGSRARLIFSTAAGKNYVSYQISGKNPGKHLQLFKESVEGKFYEITPSVVEKIADEFKH